MGWISGVVIADFGNGWEGNFDDLPVPTLHLDARRSQSLRTAEDEKQLTELRNERNSASSGLKPQLLSQYERIRKKWHGSAVAEVVDSRCTGCNIALRPQFVQEVRRGDEVLQCESCGRLLFYNPPVDIEKEMAETGPSKATQ